MTPSERPEGCKRLPGVALAKTGRHRLTARTSPSQGGNRGSIPLGGTKYNGGCPDPDVYNIADRESVTLPKQSRDDSRWGYNL
jgi:hypothetical protein